MDRRSSISAWRLLLLGDLGNLQRQFGLAVARGKAEDLQGSFFPLGRAERFGLARQVDAAVEARLDPHLTPALALVVGESLGFGGSQVVVAIEALNVMNEIETPVAGRVVEIGTQVTI